MPAPSGSTLDALIKSKMDFNPEHFDKFRAALANEIAKQWGTWLKSCKWGGLAVTGQGIGAWAGNGNGGVLTASSMTISPDAVFSGAGFTVQTDAAKLFLNSLRDVLQNKFSTWVSSVKFKGVSFVGTSTATPLAPGAFMANNTPMPLIAISTAPPISGIRPIWESQLRAIFKVDSDACSIKKFTYAVSSSVEELFVSQFLSTTMGMGSSATGPAAPSTGSGASVSTTAGKLN
jgi:hypothetical protein